MNKTVQGLIFTPALAALSAFGAQDGSANLFNGKDLSGWILKPVTTRE